MLSAADCDAVSLKRLPGYCLLKELDVAGCRRRDRIEDRIGLAGRVGLKIFCLRMSREKIQDSRFQAQNLFLIKNIGQLKINTNDSL